MNRTIRWGILGCGKIARKFAADLQYAEGAELVAAGARSAESVNAFAAEYPVKRAYARYEELVQDEEVDVIYVASPHALHQQHSLLCLHHGKAVLCEKAFAMNEREAREMVALAQSKQLFLMEALWTKFTPRFQIWQQMLKENKTGPVQNVLINFGFVPPQPAPARLLDPALGGGTLLDIGIYNVFTALSVLGVPDQVEAAMTAPARGGADEQCAILFRYNSGAMAQLFSSFRSNLATEADISGPNGRIRLASRFYEPFADIEYYPEYVNSRQIISVPREPGFGYQYEIRHVNDCLRRQLTESPVMTHADSLQLMRVLDRVRAAMGLRYAADDGA